MNRRSRTATANKIVETIKLCVVENDQLNEALHHGRRVQQQRDLRKILCFGERSINALVSRGFELVCHATIAPMDAFGCVEYPRKDII